jgi:hypothetical protein
MGPKVSQKQIEAVTKLAAPKRYSHFIKVVADWREVWGLYDDGWAMSETENGEQVLPFWPAKEYAEICAVDEWSKFKPKSIDLEDFMNVVLPELKEEGVSPGIFFVSGAGSTDVLVDTILEDLKTELSRYE